MDSQKVSGESEQRRDMLILLDCSPRKIAEYSARYGYPFGQLRTPLTNYALAGDVSIGRTTR